MIRFEIPEDTERMAKRPTLTLTIDGDVGRVQNVSIYFNSETEEEMTVRLQEYEERIAAISQQEKATGGQ